MGEVFEFNLVDEGWIPCEVEDGSLCELSLREVLVQAHDLRGLWGESPLVAATLYRLLLTVLHRIHGPADARAWGKLWKAGRFDEEQVEAYLKKWRQEWARERQWPNRRAAAGCGSARTRAVGRTELQDDWGIGDLCRILPLLRPGAQDEGFVAPLEV